MDFNILGDNQKIQSIPNLISRQISSLQYNQRDQSKSSPEANIYLWTKADQEYYSSSYKQQNYVCNIIILLLFFQHVAND